MSEQRPVEVAALSWIFELPRDLGLDENTATTVATASTPVPGWEGRLDRLPDWPGHPTNAIPYRRLRFRRAQVRIGMPAEATQRTYGELLAVRRLSWLRQRLRLNFQSGRGAKEWKTICQLTQWYLGDDVPNLHDGAEFDESSPLRTDLAEMLAELDLWLQTYGAAAGEVDIGSIALHDIPAEIPWFLQLRTAPNSYDIVSGGTLLLHGRIPNIEPLRGNDPAARLASVVAADGPQAHPLFCGVLMMVQAQAHAVAGRGRQAVIDMGTAVESVVSSVIREALVRREHSEGEIERVLERRWKDIFNRHLLEVLGVPIGQAGPHHSRWWAEHYRTRVEAVHTGARTPLNVAMNAIAETWDLIDWIGVRLRAIPELADMGEVLEIERFRLVDVTDGPHPETNRWHGSPS
jgi:hypothetical protein